LNTSENEGVEKEQLNVGAPTVEEDEDAGMEEGYADGDDIDTSADPDPDPKFTPTEEEKKVKPGPDAKAPAELTGDDALLKRFENLLDGRLRNHSGDVKKMIGDQLKVSQDAATSAAKAATKEAGADLPTDKLVQAALKDSVSLQKLEDDFPEYAQALKESQGIAAATMKADIMDSIKKSGATSIDTSKFVNSDEVTDLKHTIIGMKHSTWDVDVGTPEFSAWIEAQAADIQQLASSDRPADAIKMMDQYYAAKAEEPGDTTSKPAGRSDPKKRLAAAAAATTGNNSGNRSTAKVLDEDDAMEHGYNNG